MRQSVCNCLMYEEDTATALIVQAGLEPTSKLFFPIQRPANGPPKADPRRTGISTRLQNLQIEVALFPRLLSKIGKHASVLHSPHELSQVNFESGGST